MTSTAQLAKHLRELYFGGNWTWSNFKDQLDGISWQEASTKVHSFNTIATLIYHMNYYTDAASKALNGEGFNTQDELSFEHPPIRFREDWDELVEKTFNLAEVFARQIEQLPDELLFETFMDEKYGTYYRTILGIIEHAHYHLGQIALIKKLLKEPFVPWVKPTETEEEVMNYIHKLDELQRIPFHPREKIAENLDQAHALISSYLHSSYHLLLRSDFDVFLEKGRFTVLNTFHGGIVFLKVPEAIERVDLEFFSDRSVINASVTFASDQRAYENVKNNPDAGKMESIEWNLIKLFPHMHRYPKRVQRMLLVILKKMTITIFESDQNTPYMQLENEFPVKLSIDNQLVSSENIRLTER